MVAGQDQQRQVSQLYLKVLESNDVLPNFWMSEEYIVKSNLLWVVEAHLKGFKQTGFDGWFFPPLDDSNRIILGGVDVYAGLLVNHGILNAQFLDYQFFYRTKDFFTMSGKRWKVFRRNVQKYLREQGEHLYYRKIGEDCQESVIDILLKWSNNRQIYDSEVFVKYILEGENRWGLFDGDELLGLNVFDENYKFVNYRYCIDSGKFFLNKLMRYYFYTSSVVVNKDKLINDGGSLGSEGLYQFKQRLNPFKICKVFSYQK